MFALYSLRTAAVVAARAARAAADAAATRPRRLLRALRTPRLGTLLAYSPTLLLRRAPSIAVFPVPVLMMLHACTLEALGVPLCPRSFCHHALEPVTMKCCDYR